jgi:hypothetical protein
MDDEIEAAFVAGAVSALRKRAQRQAKLAAEGTAVGDRGAVIRTGEGALAARLAVALEDAAAELEGGVAHG